MRTAAERDPSAAATRRLLIALLAAGLVVVAFKLFIAATTTGTDDVLFYQQFAMAIGKVGPIEVYGRRFLVNYNHPPLTGLLVVSGFHGNTDGIFIFLTLLAAWLLLDRDAPLLAGLALAAAGGIKLVPLILLPIFLAVLLRRRAGLARFGIAFAAATAALWIPVVARELPVVRRNVLGYAGQPVDWGVVLVARALGHPGRIVAFLAGPGRFLIILASVFPAALWAWRRPERGYAAIGLALASFLVLAPAWAPQYLAWPVVFGYLWHRRVANTYSLVAAFLLVYTYTRWSRGFPWDWAHPQPLDRAGVLLGVAVWLVLIAWVLIGLGQAWRQAAPRTEAVSPAA